ncbi:hypothetical protein pdam_00003588 [Pocillopora damicornis]|uniref:Reverse transcriptase domain-containing protein n=1 Tax=Pocillopora damicornis TaxID=46731 RepID=A0A3M6V6T6_POCDA|nr:hypothetical protein pdam_00003588 [Pocillopora damicornis]
MIACFHHNGRQHRFTIFIKGKYLRLWKLLSYFTSEYTSIACFHLDSFLNHHNLITDSQWGFRKGRSSELLLRRMTE